MEIINAVCCLIIIIVTFVLISKLRLIQKKSKANQLIKFFEQHQLKKCDNKTIYLFIHFTGVDNNKYLDEIYESYVDINVIVIYIAPIWKFRSTERTYFYLTFFNDENGVFSNKLGIEIYPYFILIDSAGMIKSEGIFTLPKPKTQIIVG